MAGRRMLKELQHFKELAFINGEWRTGGRMNKFPVLNPATGEVLANVPDLSEEDIVNAVQSADDAFQKWRFSSCKVRSSLLKEAANKMLANSNDLAAIITLECGKPIQESIMEVKYAASYLEWFAEEAKRINGDVLPTIDPSSRKFVLKQPVGVCGLITPWNFPLGMVTRKVAAAVAAGCTTVLKPSEDTPLSALAFGKIMEEVNSPAGLFNVITCSQDNAQVAGNLLCESNIIKKLSFTGSTNVGKWLAERSARTMKKISMELGGNAPFIVFNSADAKLAAVSAVKSRFRNTGQTCICSERILVQDGIFDDFMEEFTKAVELLKFGDPMDATTTISCVINNKALTKVSEHVDDAKSRGGTIICGGELREEGTLNFKPTIITDCTTDMKCIQEETFGPVASVLRFHCEEEALALANTENSGLSGYFFSSDYKQIWQVAEKLEVGMIGINDVAISSEIIPFGGIKESGIGTEGSIYGINEYLNLKYLSLGGFDS